MVQKGILWDIWKHFYFFNYPIISYQRTKNDQGRKNGHMSDITDLFMSVEYENATIPVNTMVFIVRDEVLWYNSYNNLRFYIDSYVEQCSIPSKRYV